jgi:hypothetical protein
MAVSKFIISALRLTLQSSASEPRFHNKSWKKYTKILSLKYREKFQISLERQEKCFNFFYYKVSAHVCVYI